jgi:flagellar hook-length control protein FliK
LLITSPFQDSDRTGRSEATVLQMLGTITGTTTPDANGTITALPPGAAQPATAASSDPAPLATEKASPASLVPPLTPSVNTTAVNAASTAADDLLSVAPNIHVSVQSSGDIQATPASSPAATTIVFNPSDNSVTTIADDAATVLPETDGEPGAPLVVQNKYGQIITIQYNSTPMAMPSTPATVSSHSQTMINNSTMDITDQYIHSHLPDHTDATADDASDNAMASPPKQAQLTTANSTGQDFDGQATFEQQLTGTQKLHTNGGESQPFLFSHQQVGSQSATTASTAESSLYRLPSGTFVPEGTVTDQMIAHFSVNKRLESGSVNLKLYPQELGELRMELKVEQDNVKAHIIVQSPQAQEMIDRHMPKLREALEQQGMHLQQIEVTVAAQDNGNGERFQDSSAWQQTGRSATSPSTQALFEHQLEEELGSEEQTDNNLSVIA